MDSSMVALIVCLVFGLPACSTSKPAGSYSFTDGAQGMRLEHCGCGCVNLLDIESEGESAIGILSEGGTGLDADVTIKLTK